MLALYEIYESNQYIHLVYEIPKDEELFTAVKRSKNYSERTVVKIMKSLLEVIQHLHNNQIVHRDIKPTGILLS